MSEELRALRAVLRASHCSQVPREVGCWKSVEPKMWWGWGCAVREHPSDHGIIKVTTKIVQSNHQSILSWDGLDANGLPRQGALSIFAFQQVFAAHCCSQRVERCFSGLRQGLKPVFPNSLFNFPPKLVF